MKYTKLGNTGLDVSRLCFGTMSYGSDTWQGWILDEIQAENHFRTAIEAGINFFDTADIYSKGRSEEITGKYLKEMGRRDELVIATKVFFPLREGPNSQGLSRKRIHDSVNDSLTRLQTDYIDLYQIHRFDERTPIEETLEALDAVVRAGKVRYLGASSMAAWQFSKALHLAGEKGWHRFDSMQNHYNLAYREEEREMLPLCKDQGIGVLPWSPLARGFLSGSRSRDTMDATARAKTDNYAKDLYACESNFNVLDALGAVAKAHNASHAQVALAWLLANPVVTAPIIGSTKVEHIKDAIGALDLELTAEQRESLEAPYAPRPVLGHKQPSFR
ncbi:MAG: aldo/keto reductase [Candidatus Eisenbacteria bacterium]|uniref:Aldo/keto reductase n=1 Tax=Eiseniibacteriota bacterium TaxID=2212470 RepID=A0A7Y2E8D4_UNCEI|nr:aldo/keto reductase [Candidatus Eisenbacteria bacterium]